MTETVDSMPRWDLSVVYPSLDSPEFAAGFDQTFAEVDDLVRLVDELGIDGLIGAPITDDTVRTIETLIERINSVSKRVETLEAYLYGHISADSRDDLAQTRYSEYEQRHLPLSKVGPRMTAWLGSLDIDALLDRSQVARDHEFMLRRSQQSTRHLMSPAEETLAAELQLSGSSAWVKLHGNLTSRITVPFDVDGDLQQLPMSKIRLLIFDSDRDVRRRAYEAELAAWEANALPIAAAINGIKGTTNTLNTRRNWSDPVDEAVYQNHIDRPILDAMMSATREAFPDFRRYFRAKARLFGTEQLAWYDLYGPLPIGNRAWTYDEACDFIITHFGTFSPRLRDLASRAVRENWIDAGPRPGKAGGAFCMGLQGDESRILMNFSSSYISVGILAHELGHSYHAMLLADRTFLQRTLPGTLAETASIFCETIVQEAAIAVASPAEALAILESALQEAGNTVVDISSRFRFEQRLLEARRSRELSVEEINELMLDAQRETYGDALDPALLHPYMWAVKPHYYSSETFYNFPYLFGLLFGLGLYAHYRQDHESFPSTYDDLLSSTGMADAATLAARFSIDLRSPDFWRASLDVLRRQIDQFITLTDEGRSLPAA